MTRGCPQETPPELDCSSAAGTRFIFQEEIRKAHTSDCSTQKIEILLMMLDLLKGKKLLGWR